MKKDALKSCQAIHTELVIGPQPQLVFRIDRQVKPLSTPSSNSQIKKKKKKFN